MERSKLPNREYPYYLIKLGKLCYVNDSSRNGKKKEISSYKFTHNESVLFAFDKGSIVKQLADKRVGHLVVNNATFVAYIGQG